MKLSKKEIEKEENLLKNVMLETLRQDKETNFENCKPLYDQWAEKEGMLPLTYSKYEKRFDAAAQSIRLV